MGAGWKLSRCPQRPNPPILQILGSARNIPSSCLMHQYASWLGRFGPHTSRVVLARVRQMIGCWVHALGRACRIPPPSPQFHPWPTGGALRQWAPGLDIRGALDQCPWRDQTLHSMKNVCKSELNNNITRALFDTIVESVLLHLSLNRRHSPTYRRSHWRVGRVIC